MQLKRFGDRVIAAPLTAMWGRRGNAGPPAHITFDVIEGRLVCVNVEVRAQVGRRPVDEVTRADLRAVPIDDLREQMAELWSAPYEHSEGGTTVRVVIGDEAQARASRRAVAATRRSTDVETLRSVAEVYRDNPHAPTRAVQEALGVAHRTAGLYVQRAREAGLLAPASRRGKGV